MPLEDVIARLRAGDPRSALSILGSEHKHTSDPRVAYLSGVCRFELRDLQGALEDFDRALAEGLRSAECLHASAIACEDLGRPLEALSRYRRAIAADRQHADARHNHGLLLAKIGKRDEALASHQEYVAELPTDARAHSDLADILLSLDRYEEAIRAAELALRLNPQSVEAAVAAGFAAAMLERFDESTQYLLRGRNSDPDRFDRHIARHAVAGHLDRDLDPRAIRLIRGFDRLQGCDWSEYDHYIELFRSLINDRSRDTPPLEAPPLIFRSLAVPMAPGERKILADNVARRLAGGAKRPGGVLHTVYGRKIRVGYVSPDFGTHPTGILSSALFERHDRSKFEVHAFSLSKDDGSAWRRRVAANADKFHDLHGLSLSMARQVIHQTRIDILVDLAGATTGAAPEIFALRTAPVQVSYLGFPGTSGAGLVDFLICDPVCIPPSEESAYAETLIRLPSTFWLCEPGPEPQTPPSRAEAGLPADAFVLYAHHPGQKITPGIFSAWLDILRAVPYAILWLLADRPDLRDNLLRQARSRGIGSYRLAFAHRVPYAEYRRRIALAQLALDTPIYNGGATTLDALACGVPVLTCMGEGFAGRMAASALYAADLGELVTFSSSEYVAKAIAIARQRDTHTALTERVKRARTMSALFDTSSRVCELENAYAAMLDCRA